MTLETVSNGLDLDAHTTRWLVRLLYEEGADLLEIGDRRLPRGTPVYAKASADAVELQRAMARNHVRCLFVIETQEALAIVNILDLALHMDALSEGSPRSDSSGPMLKELGGTQNSHRSPSIDSDVTVCDYGTGSP